MQCAPGRDFFRSFYREEVLRGDLMTSGNPFPIEVVKKAFLQHYWPEAADFTKKSITGIL